MGKALGEVVEKVLKQAVPGAVERKKVRTVTELVRTRVDEEVGRRGIDVAVELGGSVAKDTWLRGDVDIDLFMLFPTATSKRELGELGLSVARQAFSGYRQRERYAEHPYLETWIDKVRVNIVPCYRAGPGQWLSAADRSPHHTRYVAERLKTRPLMNDIRVFKRFVKGVDAYGAEIKVGGLSGYLCELLVLHYGSFEKTLQAVSEWRIGLDVDPENLYKGRMDEAGRIFTAPLVVVDPVDPNRNVAAAVSKDRLSELVAAAKLCLDKPSLSFFYPRDVEISKNHLEKVLSSLTYDVVALEFGTSERIPDILWGELRRTQNALRRLLEANDFVVLRFDAWSDEAETSVIIFGLETKELGKVRRHLGPPGDTVGVTRFLGMHTDDAVVGPWVEEGRWVVGLTRLHTSAEALLRDCLSDGGREAGVSKGLAKALASSRILVGMDVLNLCSGEEFRRFLDRFLLGSPRWLRAVHSSSSSSSSP